MKGIDRFASISTQIKTTPLRSVDAPDNGEDRVKRVARKSETARYRAYVWIKIWQTVRWLIPAW